MNSFSSFITAFCVACILIGCLYIICPEGKLSKPLKYILSLLFVVIIISSSKLIVINKNVKLALPETNNTDYEELQLSSAKYLYSYTLKSQSINFKEIYFYTDKSEDGSIVINKVVIITDCEKESVLNTLGELSKAREVEIINE